MVSHGLVSYPQLLLEPAVPRLYPQSALAAGTVYPRPLYEYAAVLAPPAAQRIPAVILRPLGSVLLADVAAYHVGHFIQSSLRSDPRFARLLGNEIINILLFLI